MAAATAAVVPDAMPLCRVLQQTRQVVNVRSETSHGAPDSTVAQQGPSLLWLSRIRGGQGNSAKALPPPWWCIARATPSRGTPPCVDPSFVNHGRRRSARGFENHNDRVGFCSQCCCCWVSGGAGGVELVVAMVRIIFHTKQKGNGNGGALNLRSRPRRRQVWNRGQDRCWLWCYFLVPGEATGFRGSRSRSSSKFRTPETNNDQENAHRHRHRRYSSRTDTTTTTSSDEPTARLLLLQLHLPDR